jgi:hypothetical protein
MSFSATGSGMFSSEEEKKMKNKKNHVIMTTILATFSSIIDSLPCAEGEPLVTVWGQILVDRLYEMLSYANSDIHSIAARVLGSFSLICSGGGKIENSSLRSLLDQSKRSKISARSKRLGISEVFKRDNKDERDEDEFLREDQGEKEREGEEGEGVWLIEACLGRLNAGLSSAYEKKG